MTIKAFQPALKNSILIVLFIFFNLHSNSILQAQVSKTINSTAGSLSSELTTEEKNTITSLTVLGTIDARDFKTMRDSLWLEFLDLSGVSIVAYKGDNGTGFERDTYLKNNLPESAFEDCDELTTIILPSSVTTIESWAFDWCTSLKSVNIPCSVAKIEEEAFDYCIRLESVLIPASVESISSDAFRRGSGLIIVDENNANYSSIDGVLFNKQKTELIFCPISKVGKYIIPSSVIKIGNDAFDDCIGLNSIDIPNSVTSIGSEAFYDCCGLTSINIPMDVTSLGATVFSGCEGLNSIYAYPIIPIDLKNYWNVFERINQNTCILYVQKGSKSAYQTANQWKDFSNIVEIDTSTGIVQSGISTDTKIYASIQTIYVLLPGTPKNARITIYDMNGRLIDSNITDQLLTSIPISRSGVYLVQIDNGFSKQVKKVVISLF